MENLMTYDEWINEKLSKFGDWEWSKNEVDIIIRDTSSNPTVLLEQLKDFFSKLGVDHLKEGNLQKLFDTGLQRPEDIIILSKEDIQYVLGSKVMGTKIYNSLRAALTNIPLYKLMGAHSSMGRGVGIRKMKLLWEAFEGDMSKCASKENIIPVSGFDEKTATLIAKGYNEFQKFYKDIEDLVTLQEFKPSNPDGKLAGMNFVVTGFRDKDLEQKIIDNGGKVTSGVSKKTTCLIVADIETTSTKAKKAFALNLPVLTVNGFLQNYLQE